MIERGEYMVRGLKYRTRFLCLEKFSGNFADTIIVLKYKLKYPESYIFQLKYTDNIWKETYLYLNCDEYTALKIWSEIGKDMI